MAQARDVKIKICGLMTTKDSELMNEVRPDYAGFVFARTRHYLTDERAATLRSYLSPEIPAVGVFVDEPIEHIVKLVTAGTIQLIQLHGSEDARYMERLRELLSQIPGGGYDDIPIIRAAKVRTGAEPAEAQALPCDYLLLDAYDPQLPGGSGRRIRLELIPKLDKPFFMAGGIDADNVTEIINAVHPYGLDLSSSLETTDPDGTLHKDRRRVERFMAAARR